MTPEQNQSGAAGEQPGGSSPGRFWGRAAFVLACLATLIALFYAEEYWRGKRAWERTRAELLAKGAQLDWKTFIPAEVPDEQNIFKAPHIQSWFLKGGSNELRQRISEKSPDLPQRNHAEGPYTIAQLSVAAPGAGSRTPSGQVLRFEDPAIRQHLAKLILNTAGRGVEGASSIGLLTQPIDQVKPVSIVLEAAAPPSLEVLNTLLPSTNAAPIEGSQIKLHARGSDTFVLTISVMRSWCTAPEYLAWSDQFAPELQVLAEALRRPRACPEGDYLRPYEVPIPDYVTLRTVGQMLAQRAQCYLLQDQPEEALRELTLLHGMMRLLEAEPTTLVSAMVNVAIAALHASVVEGGFRLGVWREPQLVQLQQQASEVYLLAYVVRAWEAERAGICHVLGTMRPVELNDVLSFGVPKPSGWKHIADPERLLSALIPRGWIYQNMSTVALLHQQAIEAVDLTNRLIHPSRLDALTQEMKTKFSRFSPDHLLAARTVPNFTKAAQTLARNQTLVNEAFLACALERHRLRVGEYPASLEALVPQFVTALPRDLVPGQSLQYRRTAEGGFVLYSFGWNQCDDGGAIAQTPAEGDWRWNARQ